MSEPQVLTTVVLVVPDGREADLRAGFDALAAEPWPEGLLRFELLQGHDGRWHVHSLWRDREAVLALRRAGEPPKVLQLAERLGAEHAHDVLTLHAGGDR